MQEPPTAPFLSVVQPNAQMQKAEIDLEMAVLAIDINPITSNPSISDIYAAIGNQFGAIATPVSVGRFHSDFVIQFSTAEEQNHVLQAEFLWADHFNMILIP